MSKVHHFSNSAVPVARDDLERILRTLTAFQEASGLAASIILDRLNAVDGDADAEEDDPSGQCTEDEISCGSESFAMHGQHHAGPGCPISDPGGRADDEGG